MGTVQEVKVKAAVVVLMLLLFSVNPDVKRRHVDRRLIGTYSKLQKSAVAGVV